MDEEELKELLNDIKDCGGEISVCHEWGTSSIKARAEVIEATEKITTAFKDLRSELQTAYAWIIAQEKCPECFGDLDNIDCTVGNRHCFYYECCDCSTKWYSHGVEIDNDAITKWKAVQESELLDAWR